MIGALLVLASISSAQITDTTFRLPRDGTVTIEGVFNRIRIESGGDQVVVSGARARLSGRELLITGAQVGARHETADVVRIRIPAWARLDASIFEGSLDVTGPLESLQAEVASGSVNVQGGAGTISLEVMNGPVTIRDFTGTRLEIEALNDHVVVDGATGTVDLEVVNGGVAMRNIRSSSVTVESVNGNLVWRGAVERNGNYWFSTHNGNIQMLLPASTNATVSAESVMGNITSNLTAIGRSEWGQGRPREVNFVIGAGGAGI
ncbi:MAG TPA: DUF4097 family beta strand repeat-containing protein, partial [Gemmatimonadales bacterium]|nr:DUF4097 family beta strand repeat-containing protein [Gemmatimonadales bacterium]